MTRVSTKRTGLIQVRVTPNERAAIEANASAAGLAVSAYMRDRALAATPVFPPDGERAMGAAQSSGATAGPGDRRTPTPRTAAPPRTPEPKNEKPLPKIAERHWAK